MISFSGDHYWKSLQKTLGKAISSNLTFCSGDSSEYNKVEITSHRHSHSQSQTLFLPEAALKKCAAWSAIKDGRGFLDRAPILFKDGIGFTFEARILNSSSTHHFFGCVVSKFCPFSSRVCLCFLQAPKATKENRQEPKWVTWLQDS